MASAGARTKIGLWASAGIISSLVRNLIPSAIGCSSPAGPTRLGPRRYWITAERRRSTQVMAATPTISTVTTATIFTEVMKSSD
jgi:hypothetical protein